MNTLFFTMGTLGLSYDSYDQLNFSLHQLNPKLGLRWSLTDQLALRAAVFQVVKRDGEIADFQMAKISSAINKAFEAKEKNYSQDMIAGLESNIKDDRTDLDLLFGCLIDWGLPLSLPYRSEQMDGCTVHTYNGGDLIACFDANIPESVVKEIAQRKPLRAVFRDSGFASSPEKINVFEIFKLYMPEDANDISKRVRVI